MGSQFLGYSVLAVEFEVRPQQVKAEFLRPSSTIPQTSVTINWSLTRVADHLYLSNDEMTVLIVCFRHTAVLCGILRVFLHVVHGCARNCARRSHSMTHMLGEGYFTAPHFPSASIISLEQKLLGVVALGQATSDISYIRFVLG